jgi:hypothetical protein
MDTPTNKPEDIKDPFEDSGTIRVHKAPEEPCPSCQA